MIKKYFFLTFHLPFVWLIKWKFEQIRNLKKNSLWAKTVPRFAPKKLVLLLLYYYTKYFQVNGYKKKFLTYLFIFD